MLIDVHCHLTGREYERVGGVAAVLDRARAAGVKAVVCSAFDMDSSYRAAELANRFADVYFCAGFQPQELKKYRDGDLERIAALANHPKCVGIGEIGLDYHYPDNPLKEQQKEIFERQIRLADAAGLPVVVHSRDAAADTLEILRANRAFLKNGALLHCYSYSKEMVGEFAALGMYFSLGGTSTYKGAKKVQESVRRTPADRILTETDSPYLTPEPLRGSFPNEPKNVVRVLENLAVLREEKKEALEKQISQNAKRLFFRLKTEEL
mgnify:CR=1 FL=1